MKRCGKCLETKPRDAFYANPASTRRDKLSGYCKECARAVARARHHANRAQEAARATEWSRHERATDPEKARARERRYWDKNRERKRANQRAATARMTPAQREQRRASWKRWKERNADAERARVRAVQSDRHAKKRAQFVEHVDPAVVLERSNGLCGICGEAVDPARFHVDHIHPLSKGGEHSYANTQAAHPRCNIAKGAKVAA